MRTAARPTTLALLLALTAAPASAGLAERIDFNAEFGSIELGEIETHCIRLPGPGELLSMTTDPPFFVRGIRLGASAAGDGICQNTPGLTTPITLPRTVTGDEQIVVDIDLVPTEVGRNDRVLAVTTMGPGGPLTSEIDLAANIAPVSGCAQSSTVHCLSDERFKARIHWRTTFGTRGPAPAVHAASTDDSGLFYFFNQDNWEVLLKVLNACTGTPPRFWVFSAATTNVEYTITVTDTDAQVARSYFKPQGPPAPAITDTGAFATCP